MTNKQVVAFDPNMSSMPAFARAPEGAGNLAAALAGPSFDVLSIKGKVWHLKTANGRTLLTNPGSEDPAPSIEVVILDVGPSADRKVNSKVWYAKAFVEGSDDEKYGKPDCYSNMGVTPEADSASPQSKSCATCPKNVWGSGKDGKGRECGDSKRLAVARADDLDNPMLLNVPAASLKGFGEYCNWMLGKGVDNTYAMVTKIGFDYSVAHPALTFKAVGWAPTDPTEASKSETVAFITGKKQMPSRDGAHTDGGFDPSSTPKPQLEAPAGAAADPSAAPAPVKRRTRAAAPTTTPAAPPPAGDDDLPSGPPRTKVRVEGEAAPTTKAVEPVVVSDDSELDDALDEIDFDDE